jgi:Rrf2 family protein
MKLSRASGYAASALAHLYGTPPGKLVPSHTIARATGTPCLFLLKVLTSLVRAGLVLAVKGPNGGFRLARPAKAISLLQVIEAIDGPVRGMAPQVVGVDGGQLDRKLHAACDAAAEAVRRTLGRVSVAELAGGRR